MGKKKKNFQRFVVATPNYRGYLEIYVAKVKVVCTAHLVDYKKLGKRFSFVLVWNLVKAFQSDALEGKEKPAGHYL